MSGLNLGNQLNQIVQTAKHAMFDQGELAQLTYGAFDIAARSMQEMEHEEIEVTFPVGCNPDKTAIQSTRTYRKEQLLSKYQFLAFHQLSINALVQLVTLIETMLSDVVRAVVVRYPQKLGGKRSVPLQVVLEATSLEEVHIRATDTFLNELAYKSPGEFSESVAQLLSVNLLECPAFHRYMEIKATRDIFVHNSGIANDVYIRKAGSHSRVKSGMDLPADIQYFLESYECCLQIAEWLEIELHGHWHSTEYEDRKTPQFELPISKNNTGQTTFIEEN
ncbi:MAG: hypothetical protein B7Y41_07530 [Hydrogenophilales bacterium 28-61-23]|nr:MAG: hypothetical protein B7Y41_07530 [Hydrogenophilales bacterium 28-61-23]